MALRFVVGVVATSLSLYKPFVPHTLLHYNSYYITQNECIYTRHLTHWGNRLVFALLQYTAERKDHCDNVHVYVD